MPVTDIRLPEDSRPSHWAYETCVELPTLDIWARYKLVMQGMHENLLQTWWHYTSFITLWLPYKKKITNCPSCLGQHTHCFLKHLFPCKQAEQICSDDCQVLWKQNPHQFVDEIWGQMFHDIYLSIYLVSFLNCFFWWKPNTIPSNPSTYLCHLLTVVTQRACPMACTVP
jgi:hypothetical protein